MVDVSAFDVLTRIRANKPTAQEVVAAAKTAKHPFSPK